jgi:hypothetical protein
MRVSRSGSTAQRPIQHSRRSWCRGKTASVKVLERPCCMTCWLHMARILIVETQINVRHTLVSLLEQAGHSATAVATLAEAASILAVDVPDLLATDVVLTDGSSTSLAKQVEAAGARTLMMTAARTGSSSLMVPDSRTCQSHFRPKRFCNGSSRSFRRGEYVRAAPLSPRRGRRWPWQS